VNENAPCLVSQIAENEVPRGRENLSNPKTHLATFLFTDVEGSTKLWESDPEKMKAALQRHHAILQEAISSNGGNAFQIVGDAFCVVFPTASPAVSAAVTAQRALYAEQWDLPSPIRVRMGIHTGAAERTSDDSPTGGYASNHTLNRVARILSAGHGGQILLSLVTKELVKDSLPADTELCDTGEHHLKNLTRAEHLFQLNIASLPSDFPPLNTLDSYRHNLPIQLTSFSGREKELADIKRLLTNTHLLTLIGPGGTGKTRLSLQAAIDLLETFPHGAWLVELAPISDSLLVASTTAAALNLPAEVHRPAIDMLCDYLRERELLLVLDNCEHLVEACAQMVDRLLHAAPKLRIIASSREAFGIAGEASYRVPSLGLPDLKNPPSFESLDQYEAVRLFIDRATSAVSTFSVTNENASAIAQICHSLDGIPLAIELAAAKVRALSVEQIAKRLDDRFRLLTGGSRTALERHQTLRATLDWSYNLLSPEEQVLFGRLSTFVNGWTLEAAESVCSDESTSGGVRSEDILNLLEHLVNKSLVLAEEWQRETRFRMLDTMRQYAGEKLIETGGSESLCERHLEYYLTLAESAAPHLLKPEQLEWLARLEAEHENMRAALGWSLGMERPEYALRLAAALGRFWLLHCYWKEGAKWLERALTKPAQELTAAEKAARARALYQDAELAIAMDDLERTRISAEASLALCEAGTDRRELAIARIYVARAFYRNRAYKSVRPLLEQSLAEFHELKDLYWEVFSQRLFSYSLIITREISQSEALARDLELARRAGERLNLAIVLDDYAFWALSNHQMDDAQAHLTEAETLRDQIGFKANMSFQYRGMMAHLSNDFQQARLMYTKLIEQCDLIGEKNTQSLSILYLGILARDEGDLQQAQTYVEGALKIAKEVGESYSIGIRLATLGQIDFLRGNLEGSKRKFDESLSFANEVNNRDLTSDIMIVFSNSYMNLQPQIAVRLLGAVYVCIKNKVIEQRNPFFQRESDSAIAQARQHLDESAFNAAWAEGEKMSLDEALDLALKTLEEM
jgi:predicted ATPase/class 3 adenylate cyclase